MVRQCDDADLVVANVVDDAVRKLPHRDAPAGLTEAII
jgi:hypothetical protein